MINFENTALSVTNSWGCSILVSGHILLFLFIFFRLTILYFDRRRTFNKLTLLPYLSMIVACFFAIAQEVVTYRTVCADGFWSIIGQFLSLFKMYAMLFSMSLQVFEWSQYARMISFQKDHRLETVIVEQRQYLFRERRTWLRFRAFMTCSYVGVCWLFLVVNAFDVLYYRQRGDPKNYTGYRGYLLFTLCSMIALFSQLIFLLVYCSWFLYNLYTY
jgi:hypothetical protein